MKTSILLVLLSSLVGCAPDLTQLTAPPPGRTATIDNQDDVIELSRGVALAFECARCEDATISVDDETIAELRRAHLNDLGETGYYASPGRDRTGHVLLGRTPGITQLHVKLPDRENARYRVTVLDD
jgi:hypothetical protein